MLQLSKPYRGPLDPRISTQGSQVTLDLQVCVGVLGEGSMGIISPFKGTPTSTYTTPTKKY